MAALSLALAACNASPPAPRAEAHRAPPSAALPAPAAVPAPALPYVEVVTGGARPEESLPLIVAIHGLGDAPERFIHLFDGLPARARIVAPRSETQYANGYSWFAFRRGAPDFAGPAMSARADELAKFAGAVAAHRPTRGLPIFTGFSQGGALSFLVAIRHPDAIAAAVPIGGWIPPSLMPATKPDRLVPIIALHGAADALVPVDRTRAGVARLTELGFSVELREFQGVDHAIPPAIRDALFGLLSLHCERG